MKEEKEKKDGRNREKVEEKVEKIKRIKTKEEGVGGRKRWLNKNERGKREEIRQVKRERKIDSRKEVNIFVCR